jgi:hypothetical protein
MGDFPYPGFSYLEFAFAMPRAKPTTSDTQATRSPPGGLEVL